MIPSPTQFLLEQWPGQCPSGPLHLYPTPGVPCTSPLPAPRPFPVQGWLLQVLWGAPAASAKRFPVRAGLQQLGWLHFQLCFGSRST